jgi:hypothetical protein
MSLLEFHQLDRAREAGRRAVHEALEQAQDRRLDLGGAGIPAAAID